MRPPLGFRLRHCRGTWRAFEAVPNNRLNDPSVAALIVSARDVTQAVTADAETVALVRQSGKSIAEVCRTAPSEIDKCFKAWWRR